MTVQIQQPPGVNVGVSNPGTIVYIKGNESTDGSIRLRLTTGDSEAHIEARASGVWNDAGFRFAASSVSIGRDTILSGAAGFIETNNPSGIVGHTRSVIPHIEFDDAGTREPHTPILKAEEIFSIFTRAVSEIIATTIGINLGVSPGRFLEESIHEVGSVGSTSPITVTVYQGSDNTGFIKDRRDLPANAMVANTTLEIRYDNDLGFRAGEANFMEFVSAANISLKTDSGGNPLTKHEAHQLDELGLITENLVYDESLDHILNESLDPVYAEQF